MIVKIGRPGRSFKGLSTYLTHDPKAATSERVAWTHTLNLANDHVPSAVNEMYQTFLDAELLKEEAGVRRGGRVLDAPVKHVSLNWHPDDTPSKAHMIETTQSFLRHMGWDEYQAILVCHNDHSYEHVHVELSTVHPETGLKLDDSLEKRRAQTWALEYERSQEQIRCEQRLLPVNEREDAPTREAWQTMQEAERQHQAAEAVQQVRGDAISPALPGEEGAWAQLKRLQRQEREAFFADGKDVYKAARDHAFRDVRDEFREDWRDYYAAKRDGLDAGLLQEIKAGLIEQQREALADRRDEMSSVLREDRDAIYASLLAVQQAERSTFTARTANGEDGHALLAEFRNDRKAAAAVANENNPAARDFEIVSDTHVSLTMDFRQAAMEACGAETNGQPGRHTLADEDGPRGECAAENPRVRDSIDIGAALGAAAIGGAADFGERLFDGFLDDAPRPKAQPAVERAPSVEQPRDLFAAAANAAQRRAEQEAEEASRNEWWDERRSRARD